VAVFIRWLGNEPKVSPKGSEERKGRQAAMALGDQLGQSSGKITGTRVLTPVGEPVQIEVSFQGSGNMLGEEITDTATYSQVFRPGGVFYGEGDALWITNDGESAHFAAFSVGRPTGASPPVILPSVVLRSPPLRS
jgi:hypothetical protein